MSNFSDLKYFPIASQITNRKDHIEKQREGGKIEEVELFSTLIILKLSMVTEDVPLCHHQKENHVTTGLKVLAKLLAASKMLPLWVEVPTPRHHR